ncbi:MAG TPA: glycosyltransferase [Pyrinomonadaceae bacterium]|nr:glycosyltransferase [Pyrinomonadaceae bacterium]
MSARTLVIADYPVGYASGFGETLLNLFSGFPDEDLWTAHLGHLAAEEHKKKGQSVKLPSPRRPGFIPNKLSLTYYPLLKSQQYYAAKSSVQLLLRIVKQHSIRNLLVIPVTPWILSAAVNVHKSCSELNLVLFVMDDWQGHHESHHLPYSRRRQRLLHEAVNRAHARFAVSKEMAAHYEDVYGKRWQVAHNGISTDGIQKSAPATTDKRQVLLAGDINEFRFDAVMSFAEAIQRYNCRSGRTLDFVVLGEVALKHRGPLAALPCVSLLGRQTHSDCLNAMKSADLLYLPLAFCKTSSRIARYSLPTKLPEYLATGNTVLFHAPSESALFQVAERYDLKPRLSTTDPIALDTFLESWHREEYDVDDQFPKARTALIQEFDIKSLSQSFQAAFV